MNNSYDGRRCYLSDMLIPHSSSSNTGPNKLGYACTVTQIDELLIETYVRFPDQLDPTLRRTVADFIERNSLARSVYEFYLAFYREYDTTSSSDGEYLVELIQMRNASSGSDASEAGQKAQ